MADYLGKLRNMLQVPPGQNKALWTAQHPVRAGLGAALDDGPQNKPGDDSIQPTTSPLDVLPYTEMGALGLQGAKALAEPAGSILGNEIGAIGANVKNIQTPQIDSLLQRVAASKLPNAAAAEAPPMSPLAKIAKAMADSPNDVSPEAWSKFSSLGKDPTTGALVINKSAQPSNVGMVAAKRAAQTSAPNDAAMGVQKASNEAYLKAQNPAYKAYSTPEPSMPSVPDEATTPAENTAALPGAVRAQINPDVYNLQQGTLTDARKQALQNMLENMEKTKDIDPSSE